VLLWVKEGRHGIMVIRLHSIPLQHSTEAEGMAQEVQGAVAHEVRQVNSQSHHLQT
jgi:hypothetical protein